MDQKEISSIFAAWQEVVEKKKLDPVDDKELKGKHADRDDKDIDNDGDVDSSDEYLHNRRATIKKSMKHSRSGKLGGHNEAVEVDNTDKDGMTKCQECGGSTENHDPDCSRAASSEKKKAMKEKDMDTTSAQKAMKHDCATHVASEQWGYGECIPGEHTLVEQEDGSAIVTHYDVMFEHGIEFNVPVEELKIMAEKSHMHASKQHGAMKKDKAGHTTGGFRISDKEAQAAKDRLKQKRQKSASQNKSYDGVRSRLAKEEVEVTEGTVEELHNEVENAYMQSAVDAMRKMSGLWEKAVQTKQGPEGKDRQPMFDPDQQNSYDKIKADHGLENPEVVKDGEKEEKEKTAGVTKQASARGAADNLGNGDKKPVKQGA